LLVIAAPSQAQDSLREAIQNTWIAAPLVAARDDENDGSPGLMSEFE